MKGNFTVKKFGLVVIFGTLGMSAGCGSDGDPGVKRIGLKPIDVREGKIGSGTVEETDGEGDGEDDNSDDANPGSQDSVTAFGLTLHPPLKEYCGSCHAKTQPPLFAHENKKTAHDALLESAKVDFKDIEQSRIVLRVAKENHNCPDKDCDKANAAFTKGVTDWVAKINTKDDEIELPLTAKLKFGDSVDSVIEGENPPGVIYLEAEKGTLRQPMVGVSSATSNGGLFVHAPAGSGNQNNAATALNQQNLGTIRFTFDVTVAGTYVVFGKVGAPMAANNGFYLRMNNAGNLQTWQFPQTGDDLIWDRADAVVAAGPAITFTLPVGSHTLEVKQRREQARLDAIVLANSADFDPSSASQGDEAVKKLTFDIGTQSGVPGAKLTVAVLDYSANAYLFRNPTIELPSGAKLKVKNLKLYINDKFLPQHATYTNVDTEATGPSTLLSSAGLVALKDKGLALDEFSFEFEVLQKP